MKIQNDMPDTYLENIPVDGAPMTSLLIADLATSAAIAFGTSSDSITIASTCT